MPPARPAAIIPLRSVTMLANNDHCPADTRPLEIISGHKSLPFHFKSPLPRRPAASFHGKRKVHEGGTCRRMLTWSTGSRGDFAQIRRVCAADAVKWTGECIFVTCAGVINASLIAIDVNARARSSRGHRSREKNYHCLMGHSRDLVAVVW